MAMKMKNADRKLQAWIDARTRHYLTHAQIQMARELGMNPAKLGKLDNHHQKEWKVPLPQFIEEIYTKRFGKTVPDSVIPLEERIRRDSEKKHSCWHSRGTAELSEAVIQGKIGETATSNPPVHKEFSPSRELAFRLKYS